MRHTGRIQLGKELCHLFAPEDILVPSNPGYVHWKLVVFQAMVVGFKGDTELGKLCNFIGILAILGLLDEVVWFNWFDLDTKFGCQLIEISLVSCNLLEKSSIH